MYISELMTFCRRKIRLAAPIFKHLLQSSVHQKHFLQRFLHLLNRRTFAKLCIRDERTTQYLSYRVIGLAARSDLSRSRRKLSYDAFSFQVVHAQCFFSSYPACLRKSCMHMQPLIPTLMTDSMRPITITECVFCEKKNMNLRF